MLWGPDNFLHMVQGLGTAWPFHSEAKIWQEKLQKPKFQDGAAKLLLRSRRPPLLSGWVSSASVPKHMPRCRLAPRAMCVAPPVNNYIISIY